MLGVRLTGIECGSTDGSAVCVRMFVLDIIQIKIIYGWIIRGLASAKRKTLFFFWEYDT